ncbi:RDD family protein [Parelusimicrobium proximum]|uniref:RDD family protein n=1 Tax=Parelusimicrobium proximum TaxID=3228953 RepID=UPI003D1637CC
MNNSFKKVFFAYFIDMIIVGIASGIITAVLTAVSMFLVHTVLPYSIRDIMSFVAMLVTMAVGIFLMALYFALFESLWGTASIGKRIMGLRTAHRDDVERAQFAAEELLFVAPAVEPKAKEEKSDKPAVEEGEKDISAESGDPVKSFFDRLKDSL